MLVERFLVEVALFFPAVDFLVVLVALLVAELFPVLFLAAELFPALFLVTRFLMPLEAEGFLLLVAVLRVAALPFAENSQSMFK